MPSKKNTPYQKHIYWMDKAAESSLQDALAVRGIAPKFAKGVVCTPLDPINRISIVAPTVWNETCARQGSWYRTSRKNGLYLVVSSFELVGFEGYKAATILGSDFKPPRRATRNDKQRLIARGTQARPVPEEWKKVGDKEKRIYLRWAKRLGSKARTFDTLYLSHTANHMNFLDPLFFVLDGSDIVPYSIDRSAHLCSSCVELFQILGEEHKIKLIAPCPGATIFARLEPDRYLLVERPRSGDQRADSSGRVQMFRKVS